MQYLRLANRRRMLPFVATSFGTWWGNDPIKKAQTDFDLVAADRISKQVILCECKWRTELDVALEAEKLLSKRHLLPEYEERHYYIFSKTPPNAGQVAPNTTVITTEMLFDL